MAHQCQVALVATLGYFAVSEVVSRMAREDSSSLTALKERQAPPPEAVEQALRLLGPYLRLVLVDHGPQGTGSHSRQS
jgi:hypothetical protein